MIAIRPSSPPDLPALFQIWDKAVRATRSFLPQEDLDFYARQVRDDYLPFHSFWVATGDNGDPKGFMGMTGAKIDALFVDPSCHGRGIGRALVDHAAALAGDLTVDVNEQNTGARAFYEKLGFRLIGRSELDEAGQPYPILHLARRIESP
jgi:putative acetyltransferase